MAARPWAIPDEIRAYSDAKKVQSRTDAKLAIDIARAEQYVITMTSNRFETYEEIPEPVKTAVIILAESYANSAIIASKGVKSETFDDYSYTAESSANLIDGLDLAALLNDYIIKEPKSGVTMRMRKL